MELEIAQLGQPVLWQPAAPVAPAEILTADFQRLLRDMHETLAANHGAGLAGPQVFVGRLCGCFRFDSRYAWNITDAHI